MRVSQELKQSVRLDRRGDTKERIQVKFRVLAEAHCEICHDGITADERWGPVTRSYNTNLKARASLGILTAGRTTVKEFEL